MKLRALAVLIFCLGLFCLGQQPRAYWQSRDSNYNISTGAAANLTAPDGSVTAQASSVNLSTTFGNDFIGCALTVNGQVITGVSSPNIGAFTNRSFSGPMPINTSNEIQFWFAKAPATPLSAETITVAGSHSFIEIVCFGVTGVKTGTNNGFDVNGALPFQSTSGAASITTSNGNDFLLTMFRDPGSAGPTAGWTQIAAPGFTLAQYKIVTATQSALSVTDPNGATSGTLGDALVSN